MIVILAILAGAALGAWRARQRRGNRLDMAQWAAGYGVLFGLVAMLVSIVLTRMAG